MTRFVKKNDARDPEGLKWGTLLTFRRRGPLWWVRSSLHDATREIFCNRELNMQQIEAVGFDMDYTLAQYNEKSFSREERLRDEGLW